MTRPSKDPVFAPAASPAIAMPPGVVDPRLLRLVDRWRPCARRAEAAYNAESEIDERRRLPEAKHERSGIDRSYRQAQRRREIYDRQVDRCIDRIADFPARSGAEILTKLTVAAAHMRGVDGPERDPDVGCSPGFSILVSAVRDFRRLFPELVALA